MDLPLVSESSIRMISAGDECISHLNSCEPSDCDFCWDWFEGSSIWTGMIISLRRG